MNFLAPASPIVREIVLRAIQRIEIINFVNKERHVINTDLVPKFSEKTQSANFSFQESMIHSSDLLLPPILPVLKDEQVAEVKIEDLQVVEKPAVQVVQIQQPTQEGYGRMLNLLNDRLLSHVECFGPSIPLSVVKFGQKQRTNIVLSESEIKSFLAYISEKAKIPLEDGVFKVVVDGMLVNAIVSDAVGTKFMIKKNYQIN